MATGASLMLLAVVVATVQTASGHGYISEPPARNALSGESCPHCLNAGGIKITNPAPDDVWPNSRHGVCGDVWNGDKHHEVGGMYYNGGEVVAAYSEGQDVKFTVYITAFHKGLFQFRICKIPANGNEASHLTQQCFDQHLLKQVTDDRAQTPDDPNFWIGLKKCTKCYYNMWYKLPEGLTCGDDGSKCVLQWYYLTGNNCNPPNAPEEFQTRGLPVCGTDGALYPEEFWNCVDIAIPAGGGDDGTLPPEDSPSPSPSLSPAPKGKSG